MTTVGCSLYRAAGSSPSRLMQSRGEVNNIHATLSVISSQGLGLFNCIYLVLRTLTVLTSLCILCHCMFDSLPQSLMAGHLKWKVQVTCHSLYIGKVQVTCHSLYIGKVQVTCHSLYIGKVQVTCHSLYIGFSLSHHLLLAVQLNWLGTFFFFF